MKIGKIKTQDIVEMFGTGKNKLFYMKNKKISTNIKNGILKRAYSICDIEDLGNGEYYINSYRDNKLPLNFYYLNQGIYKSLTPLILKKVLYDYHEGNKHATTLLILAHEVGMINDNYFSFRKWKQGTSDKFNIKREDVVEYFENTDYTIKYYIQQCLKYLSQADILAYDECYHIFYEEYIEDDEEVGRSNREIRCKKNTTKYKEGTKAEIRHYFDIEESLKSKLRELK